MLPLHDFWRRLTRLSRSQVSICLGVLGVSVACLQGALFIRERTERANFIRQLFVDATTAKVTISGYEEYGDPMKEVAFTLDVSRVSRDIARAIEFDKGPTSELYGPVTSAWTIHIVLFHKDGEPRDVFLTGGRLMTWVSQDGTMYNGILATDAVERLLLKATVESREGSESGGSASSAGHKEETRDPTVATPNPSARE